MTNSLRVALGDKISPLLQRSFASCAQVAKFRRKVIRRLRAEERRHTDVAAGHGRARRTEVISSAIGTAATELTLDGLPIQADGDEAERPPLETEWLLKEVLSLDGYCSFVSN